MEDSEVPIITPQIIIKEVKETNVRESIQNKQKNLRLKVEQSKKQKTNLTLNKTQIQKKGELMKISVLEKNQKNTITQYNFLGGIAKEDLKKEKSASKQFTFYSPQVSNSNEFAFDWPTLDQQ